MQGQVAVATQRDQVLLRIIPGLTAKFLVMKEVLQARAGLTSPSILCKTSRESWDHPEEPG